MASHILSFLFFLSTYLTYTRYMHTYPPPTADSNHSRFLIYTCINFFPFFYFFFWGKGQGNGYGEADRRHSLSFWETIVFIFPLVIGVGPKLGFLRFDSKATGGCFGSINLLQGRKE